MTPKQYIEKELKHANINLAQAKQRGTDQTQIDNIQGKIDALNELRDMVDAQSGEGCEYCNAEKHLTDEYCDAVKCLCEREKFSSKREDCYIGFDIFVDEDEAKLFVGCVPDTYEPSFVETSIEINHCPKCGRKLR